MKECAYCNAIVNDGLIRCPKCGGSLFKNSSTTLPHDSNEMIKQALKSSKFNFTDDEINTYTKQIKAYCKEHDLRITQEFIEAFLQNLNN